MFVKVKTTRWVVLASMLLLMTFFFLGCAQQTQSDTAQTTAPAEVTEQVATEVTEAVEEIPAIPAEVLANLAVADEADGQVDHVISKCMGCSLAMMGSDEHKLAYADYEMHLCSAVCLENVTKDPAAMVLAMNTTTSEEQE